MPATRLLRNSPRGMVKLRRMATAINASRATAMVPRVKATVNTLLPSR